ncbi:MAG: peptidoglycan DD-metalloendopeptidase family protein [Betaproteobacteria bacterium]
MFAYRYRLLGLLGVALLAACSSAPRNVPIEDRSAGRPAAKPAAEAPAAATPAPGRDPREAFYTVQRGDTLHSIALAHGRDWRDIARWNGIEDPNKIRVGQQLRVAPQPTEKANEPVAATSPIAPAASVQARPLDGAAAAPTAAAPATAAPAAAAVAPPAAAAGKPAPGAAAMAGGIEWLWPLKGPVLEQFNETRNKGIDIGGKEGESVVAAGDGQVVYVGSGLRGYGNLVIVKHDDDFVSAYAHNREVLVKKDAYVKRGQKIAEVGRTDADQPKLHFEIRRAGKPLDPLSLLPPQ